MRILKVSVPIETMCANTANFPLSRSHAFVMSFVFLFDFIFCEKIPQ